MLSNRNTEVNRVVDNRWRGGGAAAPLLFFLIFSILYSPFFLSAPLAHAAARLQMPPNYLILNSGLVGYWTFDGKDTPWTSATAATTLDKSGSGNTGTLTNMKQATSPVVGKIGQGLKFDGTTQYVGITNLNPSVSLTGSYTLSAWVISTAATGDGWRPFFGDNSGQILFVGGGGGSNNKLALNLNGSNNGAGISLPVSLNNGKWHHVVVSVVANGSANVYYDNVSLSSGISPGSQTNTGIRIGSTVRNEFWKGSIDEVRIYNRALSAGEVATLYQQGQARMNKSPTSLLTNGLVGYWTFDGKNVPWTSATAATALDSSGQGNTGTLTNMKQATAPTIGKLGQGLYFDGGNGYVSTALTTAFNDFTACAWFLSTGKSGNTFDRIIDKTYNTGFWIGRNNNTSNSWGGGVLEGAPPYGIFVTLTDGIWHHICSVRSGTTHFIYGDGGAVSTSNTVSNTALSTASIKIGDSTALDASFKGNIDDVRIYNRALSADEVLQLYNSTR
ncbi:MAG: LamG domain-containing protein [bacterium]|nr:LamG domain-containing protein [bacterium]